MLCSVTSARGFSSASRASEAFSRLMSMSRQVYLITRPLSSRLGTTVRLTQMGSPLAPRHTISPVHTGSLGAAWARSA